MRLPFASERAKERESRGVGGLGWLLHVGGDGCGGGGGSGDAIALHWVRVITPSRAEARRAGDLGADARNRSNPRRGHASALTYTRARAKARGGALHCVYARARPISSLLRCRLV